MILKLLSQVQINPDDLKVPRTELTDTSISTVLETVFMVAGGVAVLVIAVAGLFYVISLGNPQATNKAKNTILYALIGLGVCVFAFTIVRYVLGQL
jgi:hypothetical protein